MYRRVTHSTNQMKSSPQFSLNECPPKIQKTVDLFLKERQCLRFLSVNIMTEMNELEHELEKLDIKRHRVSVSQSEHARGQRG